MGGTVLFTTFTCYTTGGLHSRQARLAPLLAARGWRAVFGLAWGLRFNDPAVFRRHYPELETIVMDGRTGTRSGRLLAIEHAIERVGAGVVIPSDMIDTFEVIATRKRSGSMTPRLVCGLTGFHPDYMALIEGHAPVVDRAFGVSALTARALAELCGIPGDRVDAIPTGVAPAATARIPRGDEPIRIGYLGRLVSDKRPLDIVELERQLDRLGVPHLIHVYGDGELRSELAAAIGATVLLHDPVPLETLYRDVYPRLDAALIFSPAEGNPNALMEAMANGVVPVCSDYAGRAEQGLIRNDETGLVFPVGDLTAAARQIQRLASDEPLRARLAERARSEVTEHHSLEAMGNRFAEMLDRAIESAPRAGAVHTERGTPASRLESLFGARAAEAIRRTLRYRYPHTDLEEWPSTEVFRGDAERSMSLRLAQWLASNRQ